MSQPCINLVSSLGLSNGRSNKNDSTDSSKWILTFCINLVSTSVSTSVRGYQILEKIRLIWVNIELLTILLESTSMKSLMEQCKQKSRIRLAQYYVKPLLELELIQMKYPENPHHHAQKYVLTEIGCQ